MSLGKYLEEINGEFDEVIENKKTCYFLKIRGFTTEEFLNLYQWSPESTHIDEFYAKTNFHFLRQHPRKFYRIRDNHKIKVQSALHVQGNSHFHSEKMIDFTQFEKLDLINYFRYEFIRRSFVAHDMSSTHVLYEVFHDRITKPVSYELITWKIPLLATSLEEVSSRVSKLKIPNFHPLPVFTKFMYMLQCSPHYQVFEELFEKNLEYIELMMKHRLTTDVSSATRDSQYYLWSFGQVIHFQCLFPMVTNVDQVYQELSKMKEQIDKNIDRKIFGLRLDTASEEKEALCF